MIEAGILTNEDKVELLENYLVLKMPKNPPHDGTLLRIQKRLTRYLPAGWDLRNQGSLELGDSVPEPDFTIVREDPADYTTRHPTPLDTGLVIEVADSSLLRDQQDKTRIYARAGIPIFWIVNLVDRRIEMFTQPTGATDAPEYASVQHFQPGSSVPLILDGAMVASVPVNELLP
jgi:Uma2 family endonuclease